MEFEKNTPRSGNGIPMVEVTWELPCLPGTIGESGNVGFPAKKFPKRTRILSIPNKLYSFFSVHSAIRSRKRNSSQKNTNK